MKEEKAVLSILIIISIWISLTIFIYRVKNPDLTETQVFLNIPKIIILRW